MQIIFQISRCWTRRLFLFWTRSSRIPSSRRSVSRNRKPRKSTSFFEEDGSPSCYDYFRVTCAHHDSVLDYADFSLLFSVMTTFRNSMQDGAKFCHVKKIHQMTFLGCPGFLGFLLFFCILVRRRSVPRRGWSSIVIPSSWNEVIRGPRFPSVQWPLASKGKGKGKQPSPTVSAPPRSQPSKVASLAAALQVLGTRAVNREDSVRGSPQGGEGRSRSQLQKRRHELQDSKPFNKCWARTTPTPNLWRLPWRRRGFRLKCAQWKSVSISASSTSHEWRNKWPVQKTTSEQSANGRKVGQRVEGPRSLSRRSFDSWQHMSRIELETNEEISKLRVQVGSRWNTNQWRPSPVVR